ncbi:MAG: PQQ-dependent sugar dehydrogenase [Actinomycetota bacterium]|nr:PQQ-dependent sugar dehydrogenase [Actinomycetota bacterium]
MRSLPVVFATAVFFSSSCQGTAAPAIIESPRLPAVARVETYKDNLAFPVDMAWVKGSHKIFFTEKNSGKIRVMRGRKLIHRACARLSVNSQGERGLLGIALDPRFQRNHRLYVYYTQASPLQNRVARFVVSHDRCTHKKNIVRGISASSSGYHNGGQLEFLHGKLFVSVGEAHAPANAQNTSKRLGKILRINTDGSVPKANPFGRSNPVWSYGHRNPFGLARRPGTRILYETENGPSCDDELNVIRKGRNYGWGNGYHCGSNGVGSNPKAPLRRWTPTIAPTDAWWYRGRMSALSGSLYFGDYNDQNLHRVMFNKRGTRVRDSRIIFHSGEPIIDVAKGPGGWLYFATTTSIKRIVKK